MGRFLRKIPVPSLALIFCLVASFAIDSVKGQSITKQVQERVYEKVDNFISFPVKAMLLWADFYRFGGFPNNLQATDRDLAMKYLYSLVTSLEDTGLRPFYGLDNGYLLGFWHSDLNYVPALVYREPGNSAYPPPNGSGTPSELAKYWEACLDKTTGDAKLCEMPIGDPFIQCQNDCSLVPCPGTDESSDETSMKWCRNYTIEYSSNGGEGFVPMVAACINEEGAFSQTPGEVLVETDFGAVVGDCTFGDGSRVERLLSGEFAYCGDQSDEDDVCTACSSLADLGDQLADDLAAKCESGAGSSCNSAFLGAYATRNYDPRWRGWYIDTRAAQRPFFSDPYLFFNPNPLAPVYIGITYGHPIYSFEEDKNVFQGVLAVDMVLADISNFLIKAYGETIYTVGIYEDKEPHLMIGVSSGRSLVRKALKSDNSQACPVVNDECELLQLNIDDFGGDDFDLEDRILERAHYKFKEIDTENITSVKENDKDVASTAYLATRLLYEQPDANLNWRIVVLVPLEKQTDDSITPGEGLFVLLCIVGGLGFILCFSLFVLFFRKRHEKAVLFADVQLTSAFILGCGVSNLATLTYLGENRDSLCSLRVWSFYMASACTLSPLFVKTFRTYKCLGTPMSSAGANRMNNFQAWIRTLPIVFIQASILLVFHFVDPPSAIEYIDLESNDPVQSVTCGHETSAFAITQAVYVCVLLGAGCFLAYLSRNIDPRFGDAKPLLFAMYNITFTIVMLYTIIGVVTITETGKGVLQAIGVFWGTVFSSAAFVVPRLITAHKDRLKAERKAKRIRDASQSQSFSKISLRDLTNNSAEISELSLKILVCSANLGNAEPNLSSMKSWIPIGGGCEQVRTLTEEDIESRRFHLVAIGMQEATWTTRKGDSGPVRTDLDGSLNLSVADSDDFDGGTKPDSKTSLEDLEASERDLREGQEEHYLAQVEGQDTVSIRNMIRKLLGSDYTAISMEVRGQMRLHIWALKSVAPFIQDVHVSGANTGIGNVLANKGGIVVSLMYQNTRLTFLSAHLAAHEGEKYYQARCENVCDILRQSKTFSLSKDLDIAATSHHMFVFGDLNFRTKFDGENDQSENFHRAMSMVEAKDWNALYSFDELHKGIKDEHLLVGFETLPCNFHPTFKVKRGKGFTYNSHRTPSYTDRILFKSAGGLQSYLAPLAYEPCVDFTTSDHKPVRGAFSIIPNELVEPVVLRGSYRIVFSDIECSDLNAADIEGTSDPYVIFRWDAVEMREDNLRFGRLKSLTRTKKWPKTPYRKKTLNPKWPQTEVSLVCPGPNLNTEATLYLVVNDYDFGSSDDYLGTLPLNILGLVSMKVGKSTKKLNVDRPLQRYGKPAGRIKFKVKITLERSL